MTIAYPFRGNIYLNITNRCPTDCVFCIRFRDNFHLGEYNLRLEEEPSAKATLTALGRAMEAHPDFEEVVFCGMGEPLMRLYVVLAVSSELKRNRTPVRLDTVGLANLVHGRDVTPDLSRVVDDISISLNAGNAKDWNEFNRLTNQIRKTRIPKRFVIQSSPDD
jgi:TatD DNase family protein